MELINVMDGNPVMIVIGAALAFGWVFFISPSVWPVRFSWK